MNKIIKKIVIIAIYFGLIFVSTKVYATKAEPIYDTTRVREKASTDSEIVDIVSYGEEIEIIETKDEWYKVKYNGNIGYIRKDLLKEVKDTSDNANNSKTEESSANTETKETSAENTVKEEKATSEVDNSNILQIGYTGVLDSNIEMKILPTINSSIISTLTENSTFKIVDIINKWAYIETQNYSGWVRLGNIKTQNSNVEEKDNKEEENSKNTEESDKEENKETEVKKELEVEENKKENKEQEENKETEKKVTKYISTTILNLREKPDNSSRVITGLSENTEVTVIDVVDGTWSKITVNGKTGYVASKYLSDTKVKVSTRSEESTRETNVNNSSEEEKNIDEKNEEPKEDKNEEKESTSNSGSEIVAYAKNFLGNPYVYGGTSLTNGCDCSGFVMKIYEHFGYSLPRSSSSMRSAGRAVEKSNLQAGDIVCFSGHVGIYIGNNKFIHAANESKGIIISSLSESYYVSKYICSRRIL